MRKYCVFAHKFPRNSIFSLLRILHCDCLFSQTNQKVLYYKQPLCFLMCEHLIYRVVVYNAAKATYCENRQSTFRMRPYPPKLSNMIISSSTPSECKRSSTVFDIIGGPRRKWLARRHSHASLACRTSSSSQKSADFWEPCLMGTSAAQLP